jgi:hypothetical protein
MKVIKVRTLALILIAAAIASCSGGSGPGSEISTFSKSYGGPLHDDASVVLNTDDDGFMLFGTSDGRSLNYADALLRSGAPVGGDFWMQKLDADGNVEHGRMLGLRSFAPTGTIWRTFRATPDGGVILAGVHQQTMEVTRSPGNTDTIVLSSDIAVAKLDASGNTEWNLTHDSGPWLNYDYFQRELEPAAAKDDAMDVWPMEDGGFLIAGISTANLEDRLDIGFPCDDEELNEIGIHEDGQAACWGGGTAPRFIDARSVVVLRLNADGSVRWVRRLTDNPYDRDNIHDLGVTIRATLEGGAMLARRVGRNSVLVRRLGPDGSPYWRAVLSDINPSTGRVVPDSYPYPPFALIQTDDPVDGSDGDLHDGLRDDGFLLSTPQRLIKFDADGAVLWNRVFAFAGAPVESGTSIHGLAQHCNYGRPTRCYLIVIGRTRTPVPPFLDPRNREPNAFLARLHEDGEESDRFFSPRDSAGALMFESYRHIRALEGESFELLGESSVGSALFVFDPIPNGLSYGNERRLEGVHRDSSVADLRSSGGVLVLTESKTRLQYFDAQAHVQTAVDLGAGEEHSEILRAAVQIGPNSYVVAGTRHEVDGQLGVVAARYDLDARGGGMVWQRQLLADPSADVLAAASTADGGLVLSLLSFADGHDVTEIIKLDADGNRVWQVTLDEVIRQVQRMPDGGFAALAFGSRVYRLSASGQVLWQNSVSLDQGQRTMETMTATADGGLVLAGTVASRISLVRLTPDGSQTAHVVTLPATGSVDFEDVRIREAADGGFVLAMSEHGLFGYFDEANARELPLGQRNVLVLKVDAAFQPIWSHVYGAHSDEGVRDLALRDDGTIVVAGYSDSLGDGREAWLLKLSPHGLISEASCQALLGSIAPTLITTTADEATVVPSATPVPDVVPLPSFSASDAPLHESRDFVTARQCLGTAGAGNAASPPGPTWRLRVLHVGAERGGVTSAPTGISCGSGLDICAADFAQGSRVALRADASRFIAWRGDCDEGTGGTSLDCVILLNSNRTVQVEFGPPPPPPPPPPLGRFTLSFSVLGQGVVRTDDGINCTEGGSAEVCSRVYDEGSLVNVRAEPVPGQEFLGWTGGDDDDSLCLSFAGRTPIQIAMTRDVHCSARFVSTGERRLAVTVTGQGLVRDEPRAVAINCREGGSAALCEEIYTATETVALAASADAGWRFDGWGGDCAHHGGTPFISVTTAQSLTCSATFIQIVAGSTLTVEIVNPAAGRMVDSLPAGISCSDASSDCSETFVPDTTVTLQATRPGFQSWRDCPEVVDTNFCRVIMNQSRTVTATYSP